MKISLNYDSLIGKLLKIEKYKNNSIIEVPDKCSVRDLIHQLEIPGNRRAYVFVHINNENACNTTILKEGDSVRLISFIGGG